MDALIPSPGGAAVVGTFLSGQRLVGSATAADTWTDYPLELRADPADLQIIAGATTITVEVTGALELATDSAEFSISVIVPAHGDDHYVGEHLVGTFLVGGKFANDTYQDFPVELQTDAADLFIGTSVFVTVEDTGALELLGGEIALRLDIVTILDDTPVLELFGPKAYVNNLLLTLPCDDLDLAEAACVDLDLAPLPTTSLPLDDLVCVEG